MTGELPVTIDIRQTTVLAVGLERYALPVAWDLPGAAAQAVRFANWAVDHGVDRQRVRLACTWVDEANRAAAEGLGLPSVEVGNESLLTTIDELMEEGGDLLLAYWCGHGVAGSKLERRLLTSGASPYNLANRFVSDIQARFQSTIGRGFARQVFIIDACANLLDHHEGEKRALPDTRMQELSVRRARQDFYFATQVGEYATFDKTTGAGAFSTAVLERLAASEVFPPDFSVVFAQAERDLAAASLPHPVFFSFEVDGSGRERSIPATKGPREEVVRVVGNRVSAAVANWRDRDELREWLRTQILAGQPITAIYGRPGIGKSAVVAKVLADFEQADPTREPLEDIDGLVYLSAQAGAAALTAAHIFDRVLTLVAPEDRSTLVSKWENLDTEAFAALWNEFRRRRIVVVLDHLDDLQNHNSLELSEPRLIDMLRSVALAPSAPRIVITTRERVTFPADILPSVAMRELGDGLSATDGVALLRSFPDPNGTIGVEGDSDLARVVDLVAGVPHGLELVASNASNDRHFIGKLLDTTEAPDAILATLVSRNFDRLDEISHLVVGLLAMARTPLSEPEIPTMLSAIADPAAVAETVSRLIDARTIGFAPRPAPSPGLVHLHPLDADYVRTTLLRDEQPLQIRLDTELADWYRRLRTPTTSWRTSMDVDPNVREFQHAWRAAREPWERTAALAPLAEAAELIARKGEGQRLLAAVRRVENDVNEPQGIAYLEMCRFMAEFYGGSLVVAESSARLAREHAAAASDSALEADLHCRIGMILRHRGEAEEAARVLRPLAWADPKLVARETKARALLELGLADCYLGNWDSAESAADELDALASPEDAKFHARALDVRSLAELGRADYPRTVAAATAGMAAYADLGYDDVVGYLQNVRALARLYEGDLEAAERDLRAAAGIGAERGAGRLNGICTLNLAWCTMLRQEWSVAAELASNAADALGRVHAREEVLARRLLTVLRAPSGESADVAERLGGIASEANQNADLYSPPQGVIATLAARCAFREP